MRIASRLRPYCALLNRPASPSAIICTYNRYDLLPEAIESLIE
jgi:glycosyltransferase involved in cell wall biosynthesis